MAKKEIVNLYATLEIADDADEVDIKKAYRSLVLRWHPDKHRDNRGVAEECIRQINAAYETLGNPTKKDAYDLQRGALDKNRKGGPSKPKNVSPKMSIPKEFMMQPLGHPDKFVRCAGQKVSAESRQDSPADFDDFFQGTKLSLWWLPEANNLCRVRSLGSKARGDKRNVAGGLAGGLNFAFKFAHGNVAEAEVKLLEAKKGQKSEAVNFFVRASPVYEGAFRFEAASRKGCFLVYTAPSRVGVIELAKDEDQSGVLDFMLVDFSVMSNFIDVEEVLVPAMTACGGGWVPIAKLCEDSKTKMYFESVLRKPMWDVEDFVSYFNGHWKLWEYRPEEQSVRLRPASEKLGQRLLAAQQIEQLSGIIANVGDELESIELHVAAYAVRMLISGTPEAAHGADHAAAKGKMLSALRAICCSSLRDQQCELSLQQLLVLMEQVRELAAGLGSDVAAQIVSTEQALGEVVLKRVARSGANSGDTQDLSEDALSKLRGESLLALAVAATKTSEGKQQLSAVVKAAVSRMSSWKMSDSIQLLLVAAKAKRELAAEVKCALFQEVAQHMMPQLSTISSADLVKVVLAISGEESSHLLRAASREVLLRLSDFPQGQLLLLTQALVQGLGAQHEVNCQIFDFWAEVLSESPEERKGLAVKGPLSADQLVKLGQVGVLASKDTIGSSGATDQVARSRFFHALGGRLLASVGEISAAGRTSLQAQLSSGVGLGSIRGKKQLQQAVAKEQAPQARVAQCAVAKADARSRSPRRRKKK